MSHWLAYAATAYLLLAVIHLAVLRSDYSHLRHTISELGESGAPRAQWASWLVFMPVGLMCLGVGSLEPDARMIGYALGIGYIGGAVFPCDRGAPMWGSWRGSFHNLAGAAEYVGGAAALAAAGYSSLSLVVLILCGAIGWESPWRGGLQRIAEVILFGYFCMAASAA